MQPFIYTYEGLNCTELVESFVKDGYKHYRVTFNDGYLVVAPFGILGRNGKIIWLQSNKPGETIQSHELVQAIGEGIEDSEKNINCLL